MPRPSLIDGANHRQSPAPRLASQLTAHQLAVASASVIVEPELLTDDQAAALLGVPVRKLMEKLRFEPWMPAPRMLSPRTRRWARAELQEAIRTIPHQAPSDEPPQLRRGRIERMRQGGAA